MTTNYPASQDSFSRPTASSALTGHASLHDDIADAVEAIQGVVGVTGGTSGAMLFKTATLTGTITGATGIMAMAIASDPHNLFDTAASNQVEANFNGIMLVRAISNDDSGATTAFRSRDDFATPITGTTVVSGGDLEAEFWFVRDTAHFDFLANNVQTGTVTLECVAFLMY